MSVGLAIFISILLLTANAFFVGAEFALISARRSVIEPKAEEGGRIAAITLRSMRSWTPTYPANCGACRSRWPARNPGHTDG